MGANNYEWKVRNAIGEMNQKRQRRFVGPMKIIEDEQQRSNLRSARGGVGNALEHMAASLLQGQVDRLRNIRENSSETRSNLG
jgi:hypothetical protein